MNTKNAQLKDVFNLYIDECIYTRGLREATIKTYNEVFIFFIQIMPEVVLVEDLSIYTVNEFFKRISTRTRIVGKESQKRGLKQSTILSYYTRLCSFFRWLENHQYLEIGHITSKLKKPARPIYDNELSLSKSEISQIISGISFRNLHNDFLRTRDLLIISFFLYTGLRKGELIGLEIADIDFCNKQVHIRGETSKSKRSRFIPLHPKIVLLLKSYMKIRKEKVLTNKKLFVNEHNKPLSYHGLKHWVKRYIRESGVQFHIHRFRHTFACSMAKSGADIISIKNMLGHSTVKMTERYLRSIKSEHSRNHIESLSF